MLGMNYFRPGVHQEKGASSIGAFGVASLEAQLADQSGLLVPRHPGNRNAIRQEREAAGDAVVPNTGQYSWQHRLRDAKIVAQFLVPIPRFQIKQECARSIGSVRGKCLASRQSPNQKAIDGTT